MPFQEVSRDQHPNICVVFLWTSLKLTFSLNLKHTDGILRCEVPELTGGECVSPLSQGADGRLQKEWLEERWTTDLLCHDGSVIRASSQNKSFRYVAGKVSR